LEPGQGADDAVQKPSIVASCDIMKSKQSRNDLGHLAERISKQSEEGTNWFLLTVYSKMHRRHKSRENCKTTIRT
jgi:hypothetical protein